MIYYLIGLVAISAIISLYLLQNEKEKSTSMKESVEADLRKRDRTISELRKEKEKLETDLMQAKEQHRTERKERERLEAELNEKKRLEIELRKEKEKHQTEARNERERHKIERERLETEVNNQAELLEAEKNKNTERLELNEVLQNKLKSKEKESANFQNLFETAERELESLKQEFEKKQAQFEKDKEEHQKKFGYADTSIQDNPDDFYDCVFDIPNLKSIETGWDIKQKDPNRYNELKARESSIVSVVGSYSKGKTFLFELLSNKPFPHGFNVHTKGISLVSLNDPQTPNPLNQTHSPIIGLDTKGGSQPLDISPLEGTLTEGDNIEKLKQIFRDHQATEDIIQNFIMEEANVIIVVVSDLTYDDQKLVNKLRRKFEKANRKKRIVVVHNLYHTHHLKDVSLKIQESIIKTFIVKKRSYPFGIEGMNQIYYEDVTNKDFTIPHVIIAKQNSEAGNYYNISTIKFIKEFIQTVGDPKAFDLVQRFKEFLLKNLNSYLTINSSNALESNLQICTEDPFQKIKLKGEASLKPVSMDEFGALRTLQGSFEPNYSLSVMTNDCKENVKLRLQIECPGKISDVEYSIKSDFQEFYIEVKGSREEALEQAENKIANNITTGVFTVKTETLPRKEYNIDNVDPEKTIKDGFITYTWPIVKYSLWRK